VTPKERSESKPSATTGIFATLGASLHVKGTRTPCSALSAPKGSQGAHRRASRTALCATLLSLTALALTATPALALAPEKPELKVEPIWAATATFNGTLDPHATIGEPGTYKYLYKQGPSCVGGTENGGIVAGEPGAPPRLVLPRILPSLRS